MNIFPKKETLFLGISTGLFIGSLFFLFFSAIFSYTNETNQSAIIFLVLALIIFYVIEKKLQKVTPRDQEAKNGGFIEKRTVVIAPLICSIILIQGDIRSWFLVLISVILTWVIIK